MPPNRGELSPVGFDLCWFESCFEFLKVHAVLFCGFVLVARCFGVWGTKQGNWNETIIESTGIKISSPFSGRKDKITVNTNSTLSSVTFGCPQNYEFIKLGYIAHTWDNETVIMSVKTISNNETTAISTKLKDKISWIPYRLMRYSKRFPVPISVAIAYKQSEWSFLEIANVACLKK